LAHSPLTGVLRVPYNRGMNLSRIPHTTLLGRAIRIPLRLVAPGAVVPIVRGPARGKRWISDSAAHGYWLGYRELEAQRRFAARLKPGDVVYDIGAHVGLYTLCASAKVGPHGHVYAFEPWPRNFQFLRRHIALNQVSNSSVIEAAVCNSAGWRQFDASVCHSEVHLSETGSASVPTVSIDGFLAGDPGVRPPTVIRIDARDAEAEVLCGARRTIVECSPLIWLSTYSEEAGGECRKLLSSWGYTFDPPAGGVPRAEGTWVGPLDESLICSQPA